LKFYDQKSKNQQTLNKLYYFINMADKDINNSQESEPIEENKKNEAETSGKKVEKEIKKANSEEKNKEEEAEISTTDFDSDDADMPKASASSGDGEELPEDVVKKLEKKKQERNKKEKKGKKQIKKKKEKKKVDSGRAYIKATYNNTIVTLTDEEGNVLSWASAGVAGFKGPKKSTPYAAQIITKIACMKAKEEYGLKNVKVFVKGVGIGRDAATRSLNANGLFVTAIKDITPVPHNGCRPPKPRRV
jgi:small subunit ribosomal protein S11